MGSGNQQPRPLQTKIEDAYLAIIQKYTRDEQERIAEMLAIVAADMARNPEQDFLADSIWRNGWQSSKGPVFYTI